MTLLQIIGVVATDSVVLTAIIGLITAGLLALVAAKVSNGRGWARWLFGMLYVLGSAAFAIGALLSPQIFLSLPIVSQASAVVQFALQTAALVLMFTKASRE